MSIDNLAGILRGYGRVAPEQLRQLGEITNWPALARIEIERRSAGAILRMLPIKELEAIEDGRIEPGEICAQAMRDVETSLDLAKGAEA